MKLFSLFALCYFTNFSLCMAKWRPLTKEELVQHSELIVVAEFVEVTEKKTTDGISSQTAKLKITKTIKGEAPKELLVYGTQSRICAPQFIFPDKEGEQYILFLNASDEKYTVMNGSYGALSISDKKVPWFISDQPSDIATRKPKEATTVIYEIELNSPPKKIAPELKVLTEIENLGQAIADLDSGKSNDLTLVRRGLFSNQLYERAQCAQCLARHGSIEDIPYLIDALSDMSAHEGANYPLAGMATTRYWANIALIAITKTGFDFQWDASLEKRNYSIQQWTQYWDGVK